VVVAEIVGVVNEFPVPKTDPPVGTLYQFSVPALAVAPSTTVPESHLDPGVVAVTVGVAFTVATTDVLGEIQVPFAAWT